MFEAVRVVGEAIREVHQRDGQALKDAGMEFNCSFIFGGQIRGERMRLFQLYSAGNFIEATPENAYFQIGEAKYGKPIIDRVISPSTSLEEAAKCALISMDSTLRSNISVGLPLDLLVYEQGALRVTKFVQIDHHNQYMQMIRNTWGSRLKQVFQEIPDPTWRDAQSDSWLAATGDRTDPAAAGAVAGQPRRRFRLQCRHAAGRPERTTHGATLNPAASVRPAPHARKSSIAGCIADPIVAGATNH